MPDGTCVGGDDPRCTNKRYNPGYRSKQVKQMLDMGKAKLDCQDRCKITCEKYEDGWFFKEKTKCLTSCRSKCEK